MSDLINKLGNASRAVYIACPEAVADDISGLQRKAGERIALLEEALSDALDSYAEYAQYAGEFLCKKHRVAEDIAEKRALLQEQGE